LEKRDNAATLARKGVARRMLIVMRADVTAKMAKTNLASTAVIIHRLGISGRGVIARITTIAMTLTTNTTAEVGMVNAHIWISDEDQIIARVGKKGMVRDRESSRSSTRRERPFDIQRTTVWTYSACWTIQCEG
jgi:hypothetical protein